MAGVLKLLLVFPAVAGRCLESAESEGCDAQDNFKCVLDTNSTGS